MLVAKLHVLESEIKKYCCGNTRPAEKFFPKCSALLVVATFPVKEIEKKLLGFAKKICFSFEEEIPLRPFALMVKTEKEKRILF